MGGIINMGQSLVKNYIHIVFSTKHRQKLKFKHVEAELHAYIGGICKKLESQPIKIGGDTDYVHVLRLLSKKNTLMKLVEEMKSHSSKWIKTRGDTFKKFLLAGWLWCFFGQSIRSCYRCKLYIQTERASCKAFFSRGIPGIFKKYEVEYDERHVWD